MKKVFSSLVVFVFLFGCVPSKILTIEQSEKVFEHNVTLPKDEIKKKLILFTNEKFVSSKAVVQTNEDGLFSGNGIVVLSNTKGLLGETLNVTKMELTFIVKYSDNNYRVKWIVKDLLNDKGSYAQNIWGYYTEDIEKTITENDKELFDYLTSKTNNF